MLNIAADKIKFKYENKYKLTIFIVFQLEEKQNEVESNLNGIFKVTFKFYSFFWFTSHNKCCFVY